MILTFMSVFPLPLKGHLVVKNGKSYKTIRGMGSRSAMEERSGSRGRYHRQSQSHSAEELTSGQVFFVFKSYFYSLQVTVLHNLPNVLLLRKGDEAGARRSGGLGRVQRKCSSSSDYHNRRSSSWPRPLRSRLVLDFFPLQRLDF